MSNAMLRSVSHVPGSRFSESLISVAVASTTYMGSYAVILGSMPPSNSRTPGSHTDYQDESILCTGGGSLQSTWHYTMSAQGTIVWKVGDYLTFNYNNCRMQSGGTNYVLNGTVNMVYIGDPVAVPPQAPGETASFYSVDYTGFRMEPLSNGTPTGQYVIYDGHVVSKLATLQVGTANNVEPGSSIRISEPGRLDSYTQWAGTYLGGPIIHTYNLTGNDVTGLSVATGTPLTGSTMGGQQMPTGGTQIGTLLNGAKITLEYTSTGPVFY